MINKKLSRAIAATAGVGLAFASLVGISAPAATAADATTHFKIHLNVPASVAAQWNIWYWNTGLAGVDPKDNTIGTSTQTINGAPVVKDWTPNFSNDDAYGSYAEFDLPVAITALNNVMRTTESWDGQEAAAAVVDDPATTDVDETAAAKPAIEAADKPFGGDNIFPAGESWWNVNTQKREYPLKDVVSIKVHLNAKLATLQSQGWNLYSWGTTVDAPKLSTIKAYKGKVRYPGPVVTEAEFAELQKLNINDGITGLIASARENWGAARIAQVVAGDLAHLRAGRVTDPQDIGPVLREAFASGKPNLVDIRVADGFGG